MAVFPLPLEVSPGWPGFRAGPPACPGRLSRPPTGCFAAEPGRRRSARRRRFRLPPTIPRCGPGTPQPAAAHPTPRARPPAPPRAANDSGSRRPLRGASPAPQPAAARPNHQPGLRHSAVPTIPAAGDLSAVRAWHAAHPTPRARRPAPQARRPLPAAPPPPARQPASPAPTRTPAPAAGDHPRAGADHSPPRRRPARTAIRGQIASPAEPPRTTGRALGEGVSHTPSGVAMTQRSGPASARSGPGTPASGRRGNGLLARARPASPESRTGPPPASPILSGILSGSLT